MWAGMHQLCVKFQIICSIFSLVTTLVLVYISSVPTSTEEEPVLES